MLFKIIYQICEREPNDSFQFFLLENHNPRQFTYNQHLSTLHGDLVRSPLTYTFHHRLAHPSIGVHDLLSIFMYKSPGSIRAYFPPLNLRRSLDIYTFGSRLASGLRRLTAESSGTGSTGVISFQLSITCTWKAFTLFPYIIGGISNTDIFCTPQDFMVMDDRVDLYAFQIVIHIINGVTAYDMFS